MPIPDEIRHELALDTNEYAISQLAIVLANWLVDPLLKDLGSIVSNHTEDLLPLLYAVGERSFVHGYEAGVEDHKANNLELAVLGSTLLDHHGNQYSEKGLESIEANASIEATEVTTEPGV